MGQQNDCEEAVRNSGVHSYFYHKFFLKFNLISFFLKGGGAQLQVSPITAGHL